MYAIAFTQAFYRMFKKLPKKVQETVFDISEQLQLNPRPPHSETLKGNWQGVYKLKFLKRPEYRLLYLVEEYNDAQANEQGRIILLLVATRQQMNNLYRLGIKRAQAYLTSPIDMY